MSAVTNRRIVLAARPRGAADLACFRLESVPLAPLREGELLLRTVYLSLDPYMRGRMSDAPSYAAPVAVGDVMIGQTVAVVVASRHPRLARAATGCSRDSGWQEYEVSTGRSLVKLPADMEPASYALGVLGMPGFTAFVGLLDIGKPQPGETLVVAAATGAVGSVVGQIGKLKGCRVVGIAGGADKCAWAVHELGFDDCIDHRSARSRRSWPPPAPAASTSTTKTSAARCFERCCPCSNAHARIPVCGLISQYNEHPAQAPGDSLTQLMRTILVKRLTLRGFIISDGHEHRRPDFLDSMGGWLRAGEIKYREHVVQGLESAPEAFLGLLAGRNFGKVVVALGDVAADDGLSGRRPDRAAPRRANGRGGPLDGASRHARHPISCKTQVRPSRARSRAAGRRGRPPFSADPAIMAATDSSSRACSPPQAGPCGSALAGIDARACAATRSITRRSGSVRSSRSSAAFSTGPRWWSTPCSDRACAGR